MKPAEEAARELHRTIYYEGFEAHPCGPVDTPCETCDEITVLLTTREAELKRKIEGLEGLLSTEAALTVRLVTERDELRAEVERLTLRWDDDQAVIGKAHVARIEAEAALASRNAEWESYLSELIQKRNRANSQLAEVVAEHRRCTVTGFTDALHEANEAFARGKREGLAEAQTRVKELESVIRAVRQYTYMHGYRELDAMVAPYVFTPRAPENEEGNE